MNKVDVIFKCILLLYRENELNDESGDTSSGLVKTILKQLTKNSKMLVGGESDMISDLTSLCIELCNNPSGFDKLSLLQSLEVILKDSDYYKTIEKQLNVEMQPSGLKRSILSLRMYLNNVYKETEILAIVKRAAYELSLSKIDVDIKEYTNKLITNLEALNNTTKTKDSAIVDEIDLNEEDGLNTLLTKAKKQTNGEGRLKTGWKEMNEMLKGGFRKGETVLVSALQHKYKSGMMRSLFAQLSMYNKPVLKDPNKKPLNIFISFEDDAEVIAEFFYKYLYFDETNEDPRIDEISAKEIGDYIKERLTRTGYNIRILRVNPSGWTYKHVFNKILEYEAEGYEVHLVVTDYLSKIPCTGIDNSGPQGTAFREMLTRCRDFMSSKNILFINAHQLSTEAKLLIRNGVPDRDFVKEIANKGYYEGSKQIDQVVDLELHQHIAKIGKKYYLTIQRGKRRYPEIVDDDKMYFMLPFPPKIPCIPPNVDTEGKYKGFSYSIEDSLNTSSEDEFNF